MRIDNEVKLDFKDVLIRPKRSTLASRSEVELIRTYTFKHSKKTWSGVPIIASNMDTIGTFEMAVVLARSKCLTTLHKYYDANDWKKFLQAHPECRDYVAISIGLNAKDEERLHTILAQVDVPFICMDVANGYSENFVAFVRRVRQAYPQHTLIAGNVVTGEMAEELILSGADIVKVGIGPGSVCTTRKMTGVGYPQLSAIIECADAVHGLSGHVISDGGCCVPGDVAKAFGAGADFVMVGGMLAGHDECGGTRVTKNGAEYCQFYGMSSRTAMEKHSGGVAEYRASEGKSVLVPYRGAVESTMSSILGGLRSTCTYVGASQLKELSKRTTFVRVSQQLNEVYTPYTTGD